MSVTIDTAALHADKKMTRRMLVERIASQHAKMQRLEVATEDHAHKLSVAINEQVYAQYSNSPGLLEFDLGAAVKAAIPLIEKGLEHDSLAGEVERLARNLHDREEQLRETSKERDRAQGALALTGTVFNDYQERVEAAPTLLPHHDYPVGMGPGPILHRQKRS